MPTAFGHGGATGLWFVKVNVLRDHLVLNGHETSPWDRWREAPEAQRLVREEELALLDDLAARPAQPLIDIAPDWLAWTTFQSGTAARTDGGWPASNGLPSHRIA